MDQDSRYNQDSIVLSGAEWCPHCRWSKAFLRDQRVAYTNTDWLDGRVELVERGFIVSNRLTLWSNMDKGVIQCVSSD